MVLATCAGNPAGNWALTFAMTCDDLRCPHDEVIDQELNLAAVFSQHTVARPKCHPVAAQDVAHPPVDILRAHGHGHGHLGLER
jgi:hypothetical protein